VHALGRHEHGIDAPEVTTMSDVAAMRDPLGADGPSVCRVRGPTARPQVPQKVT
jgi:hypothetical protein